MTCMMMHCFGTCCSWDVGETSPTCWVVRRAEPSQRCGQGLKVPIVMGRHRVLRAREGDGRYGLTHLTQDEQGLAHGDAVLILRPILLAEVSAEGLRAKHKHSASGKMARLFFGLEHTEDPCEYLDTASGADWPTIWVWPDVQNFVTRHGLFEASFHQGMLGHKKVKPTRMIVSSGYLWERLHMLKVPKGALWKPSESSVLQQRMRESSSWAAWAPQLVSFI